LEEPRVGLRISPATEKYVPLVFAFVRKRDLPGCEPLPALRRTPLVIEKLPYFIERESTILGAFEHCFGSSPAFS
jgi:hypothetical protein